MSRDLFWLDDKEWEVIRPCLPVNERGPKRIEDRIVISGIIDTLRTGRPWRASSAQYGPYMTVFNRYNRWKKRGIWQKIAAVLPDDIKAEIQSADTVGNAARAPRISRWRSEAVCLVGVMQTKSVR